MANCKTAALSLLKIAITLELHVSEFFFVCNWQVFPKASQIYAFLLWIYCVVNDPMNIR